MEADIEQEADAGPDLLEHLACDVVLALAQALRQAVVPRQQFLRGVYDHHLLPGARLQPQHADHRPAAEHDLRAEDVERGRERFLHVAAVADGGAREHLALGGGDYTWVFVAAIVAGLLAAVHVNAALGRGSLGGGRLRSSAYSGDTLERYYAVSAEPLETLLEDLLRRRKRLPDILSDCRRAKENPFPLWS